MIQFDEHIFQMRWFNHQLDNLVLKLFERTRGDREKPLSQTFFKTMYSEKTQRDDWDLDLSSQNPSIIYFSKSHDCYWVLVLMLKSVKSTGSTALLSRHVAVYDFCSRLECFWVVVSTNLIAYPCPFNTSTCKLFTKTHQTVIVCGECCLQYI